MLAAASTGNRALSGEGAQLERPHTPGSPVGSRVIPGEAFGHPPILLVARVTNGIRRADVFVTGRITRHRIGFLYFSLGLVFFWFGALKFFPGLSPAENLATRTIEILTFGTIHPTVSILLLAIWECGVGIMLGFRLCRRATLCLLFLHMVCTFSPILFFPGEVFTYFPYGLTLEGQYIVKNLVLMSAAMMLWPAAQGIQPTPSSGKTRSGLVSQ